MNEWNIKIRSLREDNDFTQTSIANYLHVAQRTYSQYELNQITVPIDVIVKLAKFYNVTTDYILLGDKNEKQEKYNSKNILPRSK